MAALGVGAASSTLLTSLARKAAWRLQVLDRPAPRKVHERTTPRLGGLALAASFGATLLVFGALGLGVMPLHAAAVAGGCTAMLALGLVDDVRALPAWLKLAVQTAIAVAVVANGVGFDHVDLPLLPAVHPGVLGAPLAVLWLVGITNALNLVDGLDGLAAGVSLIAATTMLLVGLVEGEAAVILVSASLCGALIGFLRFNFHPASIFLGDGGSLFLGFLLAALALESWQKTTTTAALLGPVLVLGLPVVETVVTVARRVWGGAPVMQADQEHLHHRLLARGLGHRRAVVMLYGVATIGAVTALSITVARGPATGLLVVACVLGGGGLLRLAYGARLKR